MNEEILKISMIKNNSIKENKYNISGMILIGLNTVLFRKINVCTNIRKQLFKKLILNL